MTFSTRALAEARSFALAAGLSLAGLFGCSSTSEDAPVTPGGGDETTELLGTFKIEVIADESGPSMGATSVLGKVNSGATPLPVAWAEVSAQGACRLEKPRVPFCEPACGGDVCVEDDVCQPYPTARSVGAVTLEGLQLSGGETSLMLREVAKAYQAPAGTTFAYPPFEEGDLVRLSASGGELPGFELEVEAVAPLWLSDEAGLTLEDGKPLELSWNAAEDPTASKVHVKLDISHHGGSKGMIECETDDRGALSIPAELVSELLGLGVAGFPTVIVTRNASARASVGAGQVALAVGSMSERAVSVPGVVSCTSDEQCQNGETCQTDLTCQ